MCEGIALFQVVLNKEAGLSRGIHSLLRFTKYTVYLYQSANMSLCSLYILRARLQIAQI